MSSTNNNTHTMLLKLSNRVANGLPLGQGLTKPSFRDIKHGRQNDTDG